MKMSRVRFVLLLLFVLLMAGCAAEKPHYRFLWPAPPETPRMELVDVYYSQLQFEKSQSDVSLELLLGQPEAKPFIFPFGIASDGKGLVYISDPGAHNIRIYDFNMKSVDYMFKKPAEEFKYLDIGRDDRLYAVVPKKQSVLVYGPDHRPLFRFGSDVLKKPSGIAVDDERQRIYVAEIRQGVIRAFDLEGNYLDTFVDDEEGRGRLGGPAGLAVDAEGNIWVAEALSARITKISPEGQVLFSFGRRSDQLDGFDMPKDLDIDSDGNLQIVDSRKGGILTYSPEGRFLLYTGTGKQSNKAYGFGTATAIDIDRNDRIFVTDLLNKRFAIWQYINADYLKAHPVTAEELEFYTRPNTAKEK